MTREEEKSLRHSTGLVVKLPSDTQMSRPHLAFHVCLYVTVSFEPGIDKQKALSVTQGHPRWERGARTRRQGSQHKRFPSQTKEGGIWGRWGSREHRQRTCGFNSTDEAETCGVHDLAFLMPKIPVCSLARPIPAEETGCR